MKRIALVLFSSFYFLQGLFACDCKTIPLTKESIESVELIFLGKVVALSGCDKTAKVSFSVDELYRGKCFANVEIEFDCTSDCQMSFNPGQTWIIYATYKKYGEAEVNFCSYSRQLFANEKSDYNTVIHGLTFSDEKNWLHKNLGLQVLNVKEDAMNQHHENERPDGYKFLWYLGAGFFGLIFIYFISKKLLK